MDTSFDSAKFVTSAGCDLVDEFEKARGSTTPELVASAMETAARRHLEQILPRGVAVGTGCVIDTYGNTSKQTDIVLYEQSICPIFRVNNDPKATYYPCEGVIAVGEIKSVIGKKELKDSFEKIASVKALKRNFEHPEYHDSEGKRLFGYRKYGEMAGAIRNDIISNINYAPNNAEGSKIYGFILGDRLGVGVETMRVHYSQLVKESDIETCPNVTIFLDGIAFDPARVRNKKFVPALSTEMAHCIVVRKLSSPFALLIQRVHSAYTLGGTAETEIFGRYYLKPEATDVETLGIFPIYGNYITCVDQLYDQHDFPVRSCSSCGETIRYGDGALLLDETRTICPDCASDR